jgi:Holliday junction resolvasome RuvABC endonuclease subunit
MKVLALDASFRNYGYVVLKKDHVDAPFIPLHGKVIRAAIYTKGDLAKRKKIKKDKLLKTDNHLNAIQEIFSELMVLNAFEKFDAIIAERVTGAQDYHSARSFGAADGILACLIAVTGLPFYRYGSVAIKKAFTGNPAAEKIDMINEAATRYPDFAENYFPKSSKKGNMYAGITEHIADALATIDAALLDPHFIKLVEEYYVTSTE